MKPNRIRLTITEDMMSFGIDAEKMITDILNREILKEISKEHHKNPDAESAIGMNIRVYDMCMETLDLEGAIEALSRVVQIKVRQINIKHCS